MKAWVGCFFCSFLLVWLISNTTQSIAPSTQLLWFSLFLSDVGGRNRIRVCSSDLSAKCAVFTVMMEKQSSAEHFLTPQSFFLPFLCFLTSFEPKGLWSQLNPKLFHIFYHLQACGDWIMCGVLLQHEGFLSVVFVSEALINALRHSKWNWPVVALSGNGNETHKSTL